MSKSPNICANAGQTRFTPSVLVKILYPFWFQSSNTRGTTDLTMKHKIDTATAERMVWTFSSRGKTRQDIKYTERAEPLTYWGEKGAVTLGKVNHQIYTTQRHKGHNIWQREMEGDREEERDKREREGEKQSGWTYRWDTEIEFKGVEEQKTARVRKTDYKRYRKQGEQLYHPDWL